MKDTKNKSTKVISVLNGEAPVIVITKEQTFEYFFRKYYAALCFFAQSTIHNEEEAKDIVQDCFIKFWDDDSVTEKANSVKSFLYTMVRNRCIDYVRRQKIMRKVKTYLQSNEEDAEYFDELAFAEMVRLVLDHIETLPPRTGNILKKYYLQGKKQKKIAAELSITENAVGMQQRRAIKLLKKKLLFFYQTCCLRLHPLNKPDSLQKHRRFSLRCFGVILFSVAW